MSTYIVLHKRLKKVLEDDPFQCVVVPFSAGPQSLYILLDNLRHRRTVVIYYIRNLYAWSGDRELLCIRKLLSFFQDYWNTSLNSSNLIVDTLTPNEEEEVCNLNLDQNALLDIREQLLLDKCLDIVRRGDANYVSVSDNYAHPRNLNDKALIRTTHVSMNLETTLSDIDEIICSYPYILREGITMEDIWSWCVPCQEEESVYQYQKSKHNSTTVSSKMGTNIDYNGCCFECIQCNLYDKFIYDLLQICDSRLRRVDCPQKRKQFFCE